MYDALLTKLIAATRVEDVRRILEELGDYADVELDKPFNVEGLFWHPFGNTPSNISSIGLGTKAGRSLTERITNMVDALLEERAAVGIALHETPREAAHKWFGRPISGPDDGMYNWAYKNLPIGRRIAVVMLDSGVPGAPTIDTVDSGVGITPERFPATILSLHHGNKIDKRYLVGAFGQGGAASLAFCEYALVVSRSYEDPTRVGFTVIRVLNLSDAFKEDCYAYLAVHGVDGKLTVPHAVVAGALAVYRAEVRALDPTKGTVVR